MGTTPTSAPPDPASPSPAPPDAATRQRVALFGMLLLATFVASMLPLPFRFAAAGFAVWGIVVGIRTLATLRRARPRGLTMPLLVVGTGCLALIVASLASLALVYPIQAEWQRCSAAAVTIAAQQQCDEEQRRALDAWLARLAGR